MNFFPWKAKRKTSELSNEWNDAIDLSDVSKIAHIAVDVEWLSCSPDSPKGNKKTEAAAWGIIKLSSTFSKASIDNYLVHTDPHKKWYIAPIAPSNNCILKQDDNGFTGTNLNKKLQSSQKETLVITGVNYRFCVFETAMAAAKLGYNVVLLSDLCADGKYLRRHPKKNVCDQQMRDAGIVVTTSDQFSRKLGLR